ncbi:GlsB/YeaQ/YmgE family stress response membrane protein [Tsuneonella mangrovi]|uniref:GlsB/YeaQ/YmgE family stress response membrane protein n=1 Tax=Tsuneonella mangrovi TaxID=1982042 RepID=UPI000BA20F62|nr:GlsB/YeaQ/YmgE family stress response membrane protein [Tsuneonella mangrovi]
MGVLVLLAVGAVLGWLASILARADDQAGILINVGLGLIAALVIGDLANSGSILLGLTPMALVAAFCGAIALLTGFNLLRDSMNGRAG